MAVIVALPADKDSQIKLADWLEMNAILDQDRSSSIEDLISNLRMETSQPDEKMDEFRANVSSELVTRERKLKDVYPFEFNGRLLKTRHKKYEKSQLAYIFCLFVSYIGIERGARGIRIWDAAFITGLFEKISTIAARDFLSTKRTEAAILQFGAPRITFPKEYQPFRKALEYLRINIGEGIVRGNPTAATRKDAGLDIVAWRSFPDARTSKLLLLGQCAAGKDYKAKRRELLDFYQYFSIEVGVIHAFFIPHEIDRTEWFDFYDNKIGVLFDRSRIAYHAQGWDGVGFKDKLKGIVAKIKSKHSIL